MGWSMLRSLPRHGDQEMATCRGAVAAIGISDATKLPHSLGQKHVPRRGSLSHFVPDADPHTAFDIRPFLDYAGHIGSGDVGTFRRLPGLAYHWNVAVSKQGSLENHRACH